MTDENDTDDSTDIETPDENSTSPDPELPEPRTFEVTVTRRFEVDVDERVLQQMAQNANADDEVAAFEQTLSQQEQGNVAPNEKLTGLQVVAEEQE